MIARQQSIHIPGFSHKNPIPAACRVGNLVMSSVINGVEPDTGRPGSTMARQCELMFMHMRAVVEAAGGSVGDIVKVNVWMADRSQREPLNQAWLALFPDPAARPARHTTQMAMEGGLLVQCDFTACL